MKVVVLGAGGKLGRAVLEAMPEARGLTKAQLDVSALDQPLSPARGLLLSLTPDVIINCAAYTDVDGCEIIRELAYKVNALGPLYLARLCADLDATLVHVSTDFVFDGEKGSPYFPEDTPNPLSFYGETKLAGEQNVMANCSKYLIIRTAWVFGPGGRNFVDSVLARARGGGSVAAVDDQVGCPTYTADLAWGISRLLGQAPGIYHVTNDGSCSRFDFARAILERAGVKVEVRRQKSSDLSGEARRPRYSVLGGIKLRTWGRALDHYLGIRHEKE